MSGADTASAGRLRLDEGTPALPAPVMDSSDEFDIDPAALTGQESIDWTTLRPPCAQRWMPRAASPRRRSYSVSCTSHAVVMSSAYGRCLPTMAMSTTARGSRCGHTPAVACARSPSVPGIQGGHPSPSAARAPPAAAEPAVRHHGRCRRCLTPASPHLNGCSTISFAGIALSAVPEPVKLDPTELFAGAADTTVGSHLGSGEERPRFDGDTSELPVKCAGLFRNW